MLLLRFYTSPCIQSLVSGLSEPLFIPCPVLEIQQSSQNASKAREHKLEIETEKCMPNDLHISYKRSLKLILRFWTTDMKKKFSQLSHSEGQLITQQCIGESKTVPYQLGQKFV